jgi:hypothetical protein
LPSAGHHFIDFQFFHLCSLPQLDCILIRLIGTNRLEFKQIFCLGGALAALAAFMLGVIDKMPGPKSCISEKGLTFDDK